MVTPEPRQLGGRPDRRLVPGRQTNGTTTRSRSALSAPGPVTGPADGAVLRGRRARPLSPRGDVPPVPSGSRPGPFGKIRISSNGPCPTLARPLTPPPRQTDTRRQRGSAG